jgi:hypothetical protein
MVEARSSRLGAGHGANDPTSEKFTGGDQDLHRVVVPVKKKTDIC